MEALIRKFQGYSTRTALATADEEYSYGALFEAIEACAARWRDAIRPGQVVVLVTDYSFHAIAAFFALARLKALVVPVTTRVASELADRIEVADAEWVLSLENEGEETLEPRTPLKERHAHYLRLIQAGYPGLVLFSSGSLGRPKAMLHDLETLAQGYLDKREKDLVFLIFLMFDHIGGLNTLLNGLSMGSKLVIAAKRDPEEVCQAVEKHRVNLLPASPTFLNLMLMSKCHERYDLSSLRIITYGTEPMPERLLERIREAFPRPRLLQTFGTSETGIAQTVSKSSSTTLFKIEDPNTEVKTVDGELWIRSKAQVLGYLNASMEAFTEDGWFRTGDLVESGEDGYFRIKGRLKEVINVGGQKVLPVEVESVLLELEIVADCMVYAEDNVITGQTVAAEVVLKENLDPAAARSLIRSHCGKCLDRFKVPTRISFVAQTRFGGRFKKFRTTQD